MRDFLFGQAGVHSIRIDHAAGNPASGRVAVKCGFTREGCLRHAYKKAEEDYWDIVTYGIIRDEWEALKRADKTDKQEIK